ncbi:MAG: GGDEF domain-containing protein [Aquabacterium sp.]|nr:GGDEF domain-containing protein [Aquabacterium sp.]
MEARHLLLAFVLLTHSLTTVMWWVAGSWLGLSRKAARHWLLASLANGIALALPVLHEVGTSDQRIALAGSLVVLGAVSLRRGLQFFLKIRLTDAAHTSLVVGVTLFNLLVGLSAGWHASGVVVSSLAMSWTLGRTTRETFQPLRTEFNAVTAWMHSGMLSVAVIVFALVALTSVAPGVHWPWMRWSNEASEFAMVFSSLAMSILASFVLGYIVVMRLVRRLEHLSHHDALTGLLNRRAIEYLLDREDQRLQRFGDPYAVLLVDIDHFKRINDRLGHAAGDAVLCAVSRTLQAQAREVDRVARYGGEEFCILLPHTLHDGALQAAERLREAVCLINIPWGDEHISVSISTGMACASEPGESLQSLLKRADEALYQAKAEGRNRVVMASERPRHSRQA